MAVDLEQAKTLFLKALDRGDDGRAAFLAEACRDRPELRKRVEALLAAHVQGQGFMGGSECADTSEVGAAGPAAGTVEDEAEPGSMIGPYKLLQKVGEGGFGVVFMAEQVEPVRRKVAIKIIKLGMDTKQVIARFEAERQALAMMEHPNIAQVLDAGATRAGRPYFVMELVRGIPMTEYCDKNSLGTDERIELFTHVCRAVHHAHQKGIIHRDIKPNNVLVTLHDGIPVPKVIDFGIAKATHQRLTEMTLFTDFRQFIGTPAYMSPEQAEMSGLDVDTRSDIYSLGVLLYELLTGTTPFDPRKLRAAAYGEIQRIIREEEPPRPSTRLSTIGDALHEVASRRGTDPVRLSRSLRGDLDWIVMKALEKDRTRRYDSASDLGRDIERFLSHQAVVARAPSTAYRARKFVRRHRTAVTAGVLLATVLLVSAVGMTVLSVVALGQRDRAEREARIAEQINAFLNDDLLGQADPMQQPDRDMRLREAIDTAARKVDDRFESEPLVEAAIRTTLGNAYRGLGEYDAAEGHLREAERLRRSALGEGHPEAMRARRVLAQLYWRAGRYDDVEAIAVPLLEEQTRLLGVEHVETVETKAVLAVAYKSQGRLDEAEPLLLDVLDFRRRQLGDEAPATLTAMNNLGTLQKELGHYDEAARLYEETLATRRRVLGEEHLDTIGSMSNVALVYQLQGRVEETEPLCLKVVEVRRRVLGDEHPQTLNALNNLGFFYSKMDRFDDARPYYETVLDVRRRTLGDDHPDTLLSMNNLGWADTHLGHYERAEPLLLEMLARTRAAMGERHLDVFLSLRTVGFLYERWGRLDEAHDAYAEMLEGFRDVLPADHPDLGVGLMLYGRVLARLERLDEAQTHLAAAEERIRATLGPEHPRYAELEAAWAELAARRESPPGLPR